MLCFEVISGLKANLKKSELAPVGGVPLLEDFAGIMGCMMSTLLFKYLGLPLGANLKIRLYEIVCWKKWRGDWLAGIIRCICPEMGGSLC